MPQQINLYSREFLKERRLFSAVAMLQILGVVLLGCMAFFGYAQYKLRGLEQIAADTASQARDQTQRLAALVAQAPPDARTRELEGELARAGSRLAQLEDLSAVMRTGGAANTAGFSHYLVAFGRQAVSGVWLTSISIGGDETALSIGGRVTHPDLVPAYVKALSKEEVMRGRLVSDMRLNAREEERRTTQAPGTGQQQQQPVRLKYVEFGLTALRGDAALLEGAAAPRPSESKEPAAHPSNIGGRSGK
jgi:hypothetical protein